MSPSSIFHLLLLLRISHSVAEVKAVECRIVYDKYDQLTVASRNFKSGEVWPNNEVPLKMGPGFTPRDLLTIRSALRHIQEKVCVKWVEHTGQENYVLIKNDESGCFASLGYHRHRGIHKLNLQRSNGSTTCITRGTVVHELLHILGFAHEQTRDDRDKYVKIHWSDIKRDSIYNYFRNIEEGSPESPTVCNPTSNQKFFDECVSGVKTETFGMPYDYGSIMHYGLYDFTSTGNATMSTLAAVPPGAIVGNRFAMSKLDSQKAQAKYSCNGQTTTTTTKKPSIPCKDKYPFCKKNKQNCGSNQVVTNNCPLTCGLCKGCKDNFRYCPKKKHLCGNNGSVDRNCHFSCGTC